MLCKNMLLIEVDRDAVAQIVGCQLPDNVECAMALCSLDMDCSKHYCDGPTNDGVCTHYEQGSGRMVRADDV